MAASRRGKQPVRWILGPGIEISMTGNGSKTRRLSAKKKRTEPHLRRCRAVTRSPAPQFPLFFWRRYRELAVFHGIAIGFAVVG